MSEETEIKKEGAPEDITSPDENELIKRIEAVLFASGRPVNIEELISMTGESSPRAIKKAIIELGKNMSERDSSLKIIEEDENSWKFAIKDEYLIYVSDLIPNMDLDKATLETLAVIAWRHPVLQADVIKIRTSNAYEHISKLVEMGFVSKEKHGRSFVLKPTTKFFEYFDLPSKEHIKEMFKGVTDGIRVIDDKEEQKQVADYEEKIGEMEVYDSQLEEENKNEEQTDDVHLGNLEVYGESSEKQGDSKKEIDFGDLGGDMPKETEEEKEKKEEKAEEESAMKVINDIASMDVEEKNEEPEEVVPDEEPEEVESSNYEHKLDDSLEEFAGITKKEKNENSEE